MPFVVPAPTEPPVTEKPLANASFSHPDRAAELQAVFELFYQARTLQRGGQFDVAALRGLVGGRYGDYTLPLFEQEIADAQAGRLLEVSFRGISVSVLDWGGCWPEGCRMEPGYVVPPTTAVTAPERIQLARVSVTRYAAGGPCRLRPNGRARDLQVRRGAEGRWGR